MPSARARTTAPESWAARPSTPVRTKGASGATSGTAWRCMFDPIRARLVSSFSRNGIRQAATETICFGERSANSISVGATCGIGLPVADVHQCRP